MPQWILELRHTLTYEMLPTLELLREAVDEALMFLKVAFIHYVPILNN